MQKLVVNVSKPTYGINFIKEWSPWEHDLFQVDEKYIQAGYMA